MAERFSSLKFNPKKATRPLDQEFPELFRLPEFRKLKEWGTWGKMTSYVLFLYSKETDLLHEHPSDLKARKEAAAFEAGYVRERGEWPEEIQKIMEIKNEAVYRATLAFLRIQKNQIWTEICILEEEIFDFQSLRFKPIDTGKKKRRKKGEEEEAIGKKISEKDIYDAANKKDALMDAVEKRIKALENRYSQFYGDSKKELMEAEFLEMIQPENAERILETMPPPYEEIKDQKHVLADS